MLSLNFPEVDFTYTLKLLSSGTVNFICPLVVLIDKVGVDKSLICTQPLIVSTFVVVGTKSVGKYTYTEHDWKPLIKTSDSIDNVFISEINDDSFYFICFVIIRFYKSFTGLKSHEMNKNCVIANNAVKVFSVFNFLSFVFILVYLLSLLIFTEPLTDFASSSYNPESVLSFSFFAFES